MLELSLLQAFFHIHLVTENIGSFFRFLHYHFSFCILYHYFHYTYVFPFIRTTIFITSMCFPLVIAPLKFIFKISLCGGSHLFLICFKSFWVWCRASNSFINLQAFRRINYIINFFFKYLSIMYLL